MFQGGHDWAVKTLNDHRKDKREYLYSRTELDEAKTHDELWNSAQIQLKVAFSQIIVVHQVRQQKRHITSF